MPFVFAQGDKVRSEKIRMKNETVYQVIIAQIGINWRKEHARELVVSVIMY
jgi:hypothetical protein